MGDVPLLSKAVDDAMRCKTTPTSNRMRRMLLADLAVRRVEEGSPVYRRALDTLGAVGHKHTMASVAVELLWQTTEATGEQWQLDTLLRAAADLSHPMPASALSVAFAFETYVLQAQALVDCYWVHVREILGMPKNGRYTKLEHDLAGVQGTLAPRAAGLLRIAFSSGEAFPWTKVLRDLRNPVAHRDRSRPLFETEPQGIELAGEWSSLRGKRLEEVAQFFQNRVFEDLIRGASPHLYDQEWPPSTEDDFHYPST